MIEKKMPELRQHAEQIVRTLRGAGYAAFLVGGCVRDMVLGREPADYDVSTAATPEQVMRLFPETYAVGAQFGVVLVPLAVEQGRDEDAVRQPDLDGGPHKPAVVEVATFRSDVG